MPGLALGAGVVCLLIYFALGSGGNGAGFADGIAEEGPWATTIQSMGKQEYHFAIVADLDKQSKVQDAKKPLFKSILKEGSLRKVGDTWKLVWGSEHTLTSPLNEAGRGMELSELVIFNKKLYTFDDRTGIVFEVNDQRKVIPRGIFMEGDGNQGKGQKTEWATVKDGLLYTGSFGKEYIDIETGAISSRNNLWVSVMTKNGEISHENWTDNYNAIRRTTSSVHPAYQIIETLVWSVTHRRWYCLPRRVSSEPYNEEKDEKMGSNTIIVCEQEGVRGSKQHTLFVTRRSGVAGFL